MPLVDASLAAATEIVTRAQADTALRPEIISCFDEATFTVSHIVYDPRRLAAAIIDPVLDFDVGSGRISYVAAERIASQIERLGLSVEWLLETHVHADHLSAGPWLQARFGGRLAIGEGIVRVQDEFGAVLNTGAEFRRDGSQFDRVFADGERFSVGGLDVTVLSVPGHTPADVAYIVGDAVFPGDTIFMPDYGTARADFPGGDARQLFGSIRRLLSLPRDARLFLCHDYKAPGREAFCWETTVGEERDANIHVRDGIPEDNFVAMRTTRDRGLPMPRLMMPSIQVNMRAGHLPQPEANGRRYLKLPLCLE